jgi:hypothetical protein
MGEEVTPALVAEPLEHVRKKLPAAARTDASAEPSRAEHCTSPMTRWETKN